MAVSQELTVTEVAGSPSVATNTSKVRILWKSTQTGESRNEYTRTAYYYVSINGGTETKYTVSYTLPQNTTKTIVDTTITVNHKDDGSGSVRVRTWMDTDISAGVVEKSQNLTLTTIARASTIESAGAVTLGSACSVKWTPKSAAFRYKLEFSLSDWKYTTGAIYPNKTSAYTYTGYTIPLDVANKVSGATGTMTVKLYTYSDSGATKKVGAEDAETFTVTVPDNSSTKPKVTMTLSVVSSLPSKFSGLYIQGRTKVKATLSAEGKYGASIKSYSMKVDNTSYGSKDAYTSGYLSNIGNVTVYGYATDSREHTGSTDQTITVIPYSNPKIIVDVCGRCDKDGNLTDSGTYLKIKATRSYSTITVNNVQKNFCQIQYRYKSTAAANYGDWTTILDGNTTGDQVETDALLGGLLAVDNSYQVEIRAIDDTGEYGSVTTRIATANAYMHRTKNALALGKYVENGQENLLDVAWDAHFRGEVHLDGRIYVGGGMSLEDYIMEIINGG